jgi:hypothetical protein
MTTLSFEQFQILAYESLLLSTSFMTEIPSDHIQGILFFIRDYLKINAESHRTILSNISVLESLKVNKSHDPGNHQSKLKSIPKELNLFSTLKYRIKLLFKNSTIQVREHQVKRGKGFQKEKFNSYL